MQIAEVFKDDNGQGVRLPRNISLNDDKYFIKRVGNAVVLIPYHDPWKPLFNSLDKFSDDFMENRQQPGEQKRETLFE